MDDRALIEHLRKSVPGLIALYRFGSQAKGTVRPDSDIDLAVLAHNPIPPMHRFELAQELADRKSTRLNSSHGKLSRMPSSA